MINYLKEFQDALDDFLDLSIYFNQNEIRYKFQGVWTSSNFEKDIQEKAKNLEHLLSRQLKNGLDNKTFLTELQLEIRKAYNFLYDIYYDDFDNLSKSNLKIRYSSAYPDYISVDLYTYEFFEKLISNEKFHKQFQSGNIEFQILFDSLLELFKNFKKNDTTPSIQQFENLKLLECIYCYREILFDLLGVIDHYVYNFDKIDFSKIEDKEFQPIVQAVKCNLNLSKVEAAKFFSFLIYDKIIFIDSSDEKADKIRIQKFIENNFTYKSLNSKQESITKINREISDFKLYNKSDYNKVIDDFIKILESKKKT